VSKSLADESDSLRRGLRRAKVTHLRRNQKMLKRKLRAAIVGSILLACTAHRTCPCQRFVADRPLRCSRDKMKDDKMGSGQDGPPIKCRIEDGDIGDTKKPMAGAKKWTRCRTTRSRSTAVRRAFDFCLRRKKKGFRTRPKECAESIHASRRCGTTHTPFLLAIKEKQA